MFLSLSAISLSRPVSLLLRPTASNCFLIPTAAAVSIRSLHGGSRVDRGRISLRAGDYAQQPRLELLEGHSFPDPNRSRVSQLNVAEMEEGTCLKERPS